MNDIATPAGTMDILRRFHLSLRKRLGQNFLIDPDICQKIIAAADLKENETVLEIGPGIGALTQALARSAARVIAVEMDGQMADALGTIFAEEKRVEIIRADFLRLDVSQLLAERGIANIKAASNLPYYITSPLLMKLLESDAPIENVTVMVQKEVAQRLVAQPGKKEYGALSVMAQFYADIQIVANVPAHCFYPKPTVDSAVAALALTDRNRRQVPSVDLFRQCVRAAFGNRRKTLANCLTNMGLSKTESERVIKKCGFDEKIRGEALSQQEFIALTAELNKSGAHIVQ